MHISEKLRYPLSVIAVSLWVTFILMIHLAACSSSKKAMSESSLSVDSVNVQSSFSSASQIDFSDQSDNAMSLVADSMKIFSLDIAKEYLESPDFSPPFLPAYAASLYGVRLDNHILCSSSLASSLAVRDSSAVASLSHDSNSKESESAMTEPKATPVHWCIIFFLLGALAVIMAMHFFNKQ